MYTVDNKEVFYFLDRRSDWKREPVCVRLDGYWELIRTLAKIIDFGRDGADRPYYEFDFTGHDAHCEVVWDHDGYYRTTSHVYHEKRYFFYREDGSPIDVRAFEADVRKCQQGTPPCSFHYCDKDRTTNCTPGEKLYLYRKYPYHYRRGSVPHTGHRSWGHYTSPTQLGRHLREDVTRPHLKPCPYDTWDGPDRHRDRSWKTSFKCKHQWEKHLIRRSKQNGDVWVQEEEKC